MGSGIATSLVLNIIPVILKENVLDLSAQKVLERVQHCQCYAAKSILREGLHTFLARIFLHIQR